MIRFEGYVGQGHERQYSLSTVQDGHPIGAKWVAIGGEYRGYKVVSFDATRDVLVLVRGDRSIELSLQAETFAQPNASKPPFTREEALSFVNSLIRDLDEHMRGHVTYIDLPPDISASLEGAVLESYVLNRRLADENKWLFRVVQSEEDHPLFLVEKGFDWDRLPRKAGDVLTEADKAELNARYMPISLQSQYVRYLANYLAGNLRPVSGPGQGRRGTLPPGFAPEVTAPKRAGGQP